jgi:twitching motility protein PilI
MARKTSLREYQTAVAERLRNLSKEEASVSSKLGFQAGGHFWFVSLQDVSEVIPVPVIAQVPLTKPYFCGLTNIRGNLYGVVDFSAFLGAGAVSSSLESRLLLLPQSIVQGAALLVNRMAGLKNVDGFVPSARPENAPEWVKATYTDAEGTAWRELDAHRLAEDAGFLNVGR